MNRLTSLFLAGFVFATGLTLVGCESQLEAPAALTLQTKNAVEVLPADARFVGMADLQALQRNTAFHPFGDDFSFDHLNGEAGARLQDFLDATGFDPRKDVREVYVAMTGPDADATPSLVVYASFDRARLETYVEENLRGDFERSDYRGATLYLSRDAEHPVAFALASENMLVAAADLADVRAMLDRLAGSGEALKSNDAVMKLIAQATGGSAWFVVHDFTPPGEAPDKADEDAAVRRDMEQIGAAVKDVAFSLTVKEDGAEGKVFLKTREGVSSSDVADLTRGLVAAMKAAPDTDPDRLRLLDGVRVRNQNDEVRVDFSVDNAFLSSMR